MIQGGRQIHVMLRMKEKCLQKTDDDASGCIDAVMSNSFDRSRLFLGGRPPTIGTIFFLLFYFIIFWKRGDSYSKFGWTVLGDSLKLS